MVRGPNRKNMKMNTTTFKPQEFCSRKLWQIVNTEAGARVDDADLQEAIAELATRRHYLAELQETGKLEGQSPGA